MNLFSVDSQQIILIVLLVIMVAALIVLPMITNKKRQKAVNDLHTGLRAGDTIKTVGGVIGVVTEIKEISPVDKQIVIETGSGLNKSSMTFDINAVYQVISKVGGPELTEIHETKEPDTKEEEEVKIEEGPKAEAEDKAKKE